MTNVGLTIETGKAIITSRWNLIKDQAKYRQLLQVNDNESCTAFLVRAYYRRFSRLRPFISGFAANKRVYMDYLRFKFKQEDYNKKRNLCYKLAIDDVELRSSELSRSLEFVRMALAYYGNPHEFDCELNREAVTCKQVLNNILEMEKQKGFEGDRKHPFAREYRIHFKHLEMLETNEIDKSLLKNKNSIFRYPAKVKALAEYERCLVLLNDTLGTRL